MELPVAIIILLITAIVAALALFLIATIMELRKINAGLNDTLSGVGEIATKTAPVNGVLDAINATLVAGRNLLEGLALKKAGPDAAGLVESCFPGEGSRFLQRIGRSGAVLPIGEEYPRGAAILGSLLGSTDPVPAAGSGSNGAAAAAPAPAAAAPATAPSGRIVLRGAAPPPAAAGGGGGGGRIKLHGAGPPAPAAAPEVAGRLSARGSRPWE